MSDHYMIFCVRKFEGAVKNEHKVITTRSMKNVDKDAFLADVASISWERGFDEKMMLMCLSPRGQHFSP